MFHPRKSLNRFLILVSLNCLLLYFFSLLPSDSVLTIVPVEADQPGSPSDAWVVEEFPAGPRRIPEGLAEALHALAIGEFEGASRLAEAFIRQHSDAGFDAWRERAGVIAARAYLEAGRPSETLRILGKGERNIPGLAAHAQFLKARALEGLGRLHAAAETYESVGRTGPLAAASLAAASRSWFRAGDCPKAFSAARALERRDPAHPELPEALLLRGRCLEKGGDPAEAVRIYHRLWMRYPLDRAAEEAESRLAELKSRGVLPPHPNTEALWRRTRALQKARRIPEALKGWRTLLKRPLSSGSRTEAVFHMGLDLYYLRDNQKAAERLRWVADRDMGGRWGAKALYYLARVKLRAGDRVGFRKAGEELLRSSPSDPWARQFLFLRARVVEDQGLWDQALDHYRRLAAKHPGSRQAAAARWRVAWIYFRQGRFREAERGFVDLAKKRPRTALGQASLFWAGSAAERAGNPSAVSHYRGASKVDPTSYYGQLAAERLGVENRRKPEAGPAPGFLKRPPFDEKTRRIMQDAESLTLAGLFGAAAEAMGRGGLNHPYFLYQRARLLHRARDYSRALRILQRSVFWRVRVGADRSPGDFWRMVYPLDRRALKAGTDARGAYRLDPLLVSAVILAESLYDPDALSIAGARGLMQLMPETGRRVARRLGLPSPSPDDLFQPGLNVRLGWDHLGRLLAHFSGRVVPAVAAYNAGLRAARKWWKKSGNLDEASFIAAIPYRETRRYVQKVLAYYRQYQNQYGEGLELPARKVLKGGAP
ncbi:MAG: transglycosylase SLT domain-containing protein [Nitrospinota bacterium]